MKDPGLPEPESSGPWSLGQGYFLLGDNRPESHDGRSWGALSAAALQGRILLRTAPHPVS